MFAFQDRRGVVDVAFTDRYGGRSTGPFAELNLGLPPDGIAEGWAEEPDVVRANLDSVGRALAEVVGADGAPTPPVVTMRQVHGAEVADVDALTPGADRGADPVADALVTTRPGRVLAARGADCVPVLLADPHTGVVAAAHAGRAGLVAGVVPAAVDALRARGARDLVAWVGPHVCGRCYEVPATMRRDVDTVVPGTASTTRQGTPALDLGAGVRRQLAAAGAEVVSFEPCTVEDDRFYSYRRQGRESGRHAGLVWVRP